MVLALFQSTFMEGAKELTLPVLATGFLLKVSVDSLIKLGMVKKNGNGNGHAVPTAGARPVEDWRRDIKADAKTACTEVFNEKMGPIQAILRNQTTIIEGLKFSQDTQGRALEKMGEGIAEILTADRQRRAVEAADIAVMKAHAGGN